MWRMARGLFRAQALRPTLSLRFFVHGVGEARGDKFLFPSGFLKAENKRTMVAAANPHARSVSLVSRG